MGGQEGEVMVKPATEVNDAIDSIRLGIKTLMKHLHRSTVEGYLHDAVASAARKYKDPEGWRKSR